MKPNKLLDHKGASLIEIVAAIAILSITSLIIINMLFSNMRLDQRNQERAVLTNIANGTLNYIRTVDFDHIYSDLQDEGSNYYSTIDLEDCTTFVSEDLENKAGEIEMCKQVLTPIVNNQAYEDRLVIYVFPYNDQEAFLHLQDLNFPDHVQRYVDDLEYDNTKAILNNNMVRVVVHVISKNPGNNDVLLEGVLANEDFEHTTSIK